MDLSGHIVAFSIIIFIIFSGCVENKNPKLTPEIEKPSLIQPTIVHNITDEEKKDNTKNKVYDRALFVKKNLNELLQCPPDAYMIFRARKSAQEINVSWKHMNIIISIEKEYVGKNHNKLTKYADFILTDSKYTFETDTNTEKASKIIDNIFKNVFGLPEDYIADIRLENCP